MPAARTRLYDLLGVRPDASASDIKKAYRKLALRHHPDKGGDVRTFQEMTAAHEVLSDPEKRRVYDMYGEEALRQEGPAPGSGAAGPAGGFGRAGGFGGIFDLLFGDNFEGGGGMFGGLGQGIGKRPRREAAAAAERNPELGFRLAVSLEDVYRGSVKRVQVPRSLACASCRASGSSDPGGRVVCPDCDGHGVVIMEQRHGFMVERVQVPCSTCEGTGRYVPPSSRCKACGGRGLRKERVVLEVHVPRGASDGQQIVLAGAGHQLPQLPAGDAVCVLQVLEHARFQRSGDHLAFSAEITLAEALGGCRLLLEHLDGRRLVLRSRPGEVIRPGALWRLRGEGMPVLGHASARGDLLVHFAVAFPGALDPARAAELAALLGGRPTPGGPAEGGDGERFLEPVETPRAGEQRSRL